MAVNFRTASARANAEAKARARLRERGLGPRPPSPTTPNASRPLRGTPLDPSPAPSLPAPGSDRRLVPTPRDRARSRPGRANRGAGGADSVAAAAAAAIRSQVSSRPGGARQPLPAGVRVTKRFEDGSERLSSGMVRDAETGKIRKTTPGIVKKAQAAKADPGSFDKSRLNRAVARFAQTHKWARQPGQEEAVRQAAAYLLQKENKFYGAEAGKGGKYRRRNKRSDTPRSTPGNTQQAG